jgi:hypothetical protein
MGSRPGDLTADGNMAARPHGLEDQATRRPMLLMVTPRHREGRQRDARHAQLRAADHAGGAAAQPGANRADEPDAAAADEPPPVG